VPGYHRAAMTPMLHRSFALALGTLALAGCDAASPPGTGVPKASESASPASAGALIEALRDPDAYARARAMGALLPRLGAEAVPEVKAALSDPALRIGGAEHELLLRFWASHEPEAASRWAADSSPTFYRDAAVMTALPLWVAADREAALVALGEWQKWRPDLRESAPRAVVVGWYEAGLPGLTQYIRDLGAGFPQQIALSTYLRAAMAKEGVQPVVDWAEAVPEDDPAYKLAVYRQVASALPLFDRSAAMRWCDAHCDGPYGNNLRNIIAGRWVAEDGAGALAWLGTAPEGNERDVAVRTNFANWAAWHPEKATAWMAEQTQDGGQLPAWLEPVLPVYAVLLADESPTTAIEWANRIEKDVSREVTLIKIARQWRESDQAAAEAWLETSPLSAEAREQVRDPNWRAGKASPKKAPRPRRERRR
jgi:hypothetical protein